jgi:hypothetical protein
VTYLANERAKGGTNYAERRAEVIGFIEDAAMSGDPRIADLVKVSFIENLHLLGHDCQSTAQQLGPAARRLLDDYIAEWGAVCKEQ